MYDKLRKDLIKFFENYHKSNYDCEISSEFSGTIAKLLRRLDKLEELEKARKGSK